MDSVNNRTSHVETAVFGLTLAVCVTAFVVIVGGNILTLLAIWRTQSLRTLSNMYVTSLACSDLTTGAFIPCSVTLLAEVSPLHYNKHLCVFQIVLNSILFGVSVITNTLIAFDRYMYIKHPMKYIMDVSVRKIKIAIGLSWLLTIVANVYAVFENNWNQKIGCVYLTTAPVIFRGGYLFFFLITGGSMCIFFYGNIFLIARRQQKVIASAYAHNAPELTRASWKLVKLLSVVFAIFCVCWIPVSITYILQVFIEVPLMTSYIVLPLVYINAGANCFVYGWLNKDFRRAYKIILQSFCSRCR